MLHSWRHGVATKLLLEGVPEVVVEQLLGEESLERSTLFNYFDGAELAGLKEAMDKLVLPIDVPAMKEAIRKFAHPDRAFHWAKRNSED